MFGNPKQIFKLLKTMGIRVRFDLERKAMIISSDQGEQVHFFSDIERMVNGDGEGR